MNADQNPHVKPTCGAPAEPARPEWACLTAGERPRCYRKNELWKLKFRSQRIASGAYNAACQMDHPRQCNSNAAECNE
jgi:hypothetical protein